jgi:DNA-binding GntR family transcriptional regulator
MSREPEIDLDAAEPVYRQVVAKVAWRIRAGAYAVRLPSERALAEELGVAYGTVRHAMEVLEADGIVRRVHGRGTFVVKPAD